MQNLARFLFSSILVFVLISQFLGCSKEESNPVSEDDSGQYLWVHFSNDSVKIFFKNLPKFSADGEEAIQLSSFIDTSLIHSFIKDTVSYDSRGLYSYQIVGDDGFSASVKGYPNNIWNHLKLGHIITSTRKVIFPDSKIDLAGAYDVKTTRHIYIQRKIDLAFTDSTIFVELRNIVSVQVTNPDNILEQAIPLANLVTAKVSNPTAYQYNIRSIDNFGPTSSMTWVQYQTGYWLLTSEKTMFTDTTLAGGRYKLKVLEKIVLN